MREDLQKHVLLYINIYLKEKSKFKLFEFSFSIYNSYFSIKAFR